MNLRNAILDEACEKAIKVLCEYVPVEEGRKKPILMHSVRVGVYLYRHSYSTDVVLAGFLHDVLEWTKGTPELITEMFGEHVYKIVSANTKDRTISDPKERQKEYIGRCIAVGEDALIVKAADTLDSFQYYVQTNNEDEINRCKSISCTILETLPSNFHDPIFTELQSILI